MSKLKETIAENGGFPHWFVNVFWYHYKWATLVAVAVIGIVTFITIDAVTRERYDTTVVIAADYYVDDTQLDALDQVLQPVVADLDGNGVVKINYVVLYVNGDTELGRENEERMYLYLTQKDVALYLMSENISDAYTNPQIGYFTDDLTEMGLPGDEDKPVRKSLEGNPALAACGMEHMYLSIMDYTTVDGGIEASDAKENAVAMAEALIAAGE